MSLTGNISMLTASMRSFQSAVEVHSNNIANATTEGFSRRRVDFAENPAYSVDGQFLGTGSHISNITRLRDIFLDSQIRTQLTKASYFEALDSATSQLASLFPDIAVAGSPSGLEAQLDAFFDAWVALGASPSSVAAKQEVVETAQALVGRLRSTSNDLALLRQNFDQQVQQAVADINTLTSVIAEFNGQIMRGGANNPSILDARNKAMNDLAKLIDVQYREVGNGTVTVFFNRGTLVSGNISNDLDTIAGVPDPDLVKIGFPKGGNPPADVTDIIQGGRLGGLLRARDGIIEKVTQGVRAIGSGLIENVNTVYHAALDGSGAHQDFFKGNNAADIIVNPSFATASTASAILTSFYPTGVPGNLAKAIAGVRDMHIATYVQTQTTFSLAAAAGTAPLNTLVGAQTPINGAFTASGRIHVDMSDGSAASVDWTDNQSLSQIADNLTAALNGAGVAVYDDSTKQMTIFSNQKISLYDETGNLANILRLRAYLNSATNINASVDPTFNRVLGADVLGAAGSGLLHLFREADSTGTYVVNTGQAGWNDTQNVSTVANNVGLAGGITAVWNVARQKLLQFKNVGAPSIGNPLTSFSAADIQGNLAQVFAVFSPASLKGNYDGVRTSVSGQQSAFAIQKEAAQGVLDSLQALQDNTAKVNLDEEIKLAQTFQRAYEASLRVTTVIDQMLNVLINHTASPSGSVNSSSF